MLTEKFKINKSSFQENMVVDGDSLLTLYGMDSEISESTFKNNFATKVTNVLRLVNTVEAPNMRVTMNQNCQFENSNSQKEAASAAELFGSFIHAEQS